MIAARPAAIAVAALTVVASCSDESTTTPPSSDAATISDPTTTDPTSTEVTATEGDEAGAPPPVGTLGDASGVQPEGFSTIQALITTAEGEQCEVCLWLADDGDERGRGLMGVTDLGDAVGMAFRFDEPTSGSFYMFQTPTPLSIAWFAPEGDHVGSADMAPCLDTPAGECPLYSPDREYDLAIEVFDGGLEPLGLVPGSNVELIAGSEADRCPGTP